jgi:DNA invertase Pin-like site-specific DNA recombinase
VFEELDISGGAPIDKRYGLRRAIEAIEQGQADVLAVAYFDRLVRSIKVQAEVVERVEAAGGKVMLADFGNLTNGSAAQWLSGTMIGAVTEYVRRSIAERSAAGQQVAIERGHFPVILIPGLRRTEAGTVEVDPENAGIVAEAFRMRSGGATIKDVQTYLASKGIERSFHGTLSLLRSRQAIGELHFGEHSLTVPALIDRETFEHVQRLSLPRGRRSKSERLLARLGVLRCASCGSRMVVASSNNSRYWVYRCPPTGDCSRRVTISAELVENLVVDEVKRILAGIVETATMADGAQAAAAELDAAQSALDSALRAFSGLESEPAAIQRLRELRDVRDAARARYEEATANADAQTVAMSVGHWNELTHDERRSLIRAVLERVKVKPGRGAERVEVIPRA